LTRQDKTEEGRKRREEREGEGGEGLGFNIILGFFLLKITLIISSNRLDILYCIAFL